MRIQHMVIFNLEFEKGSDAAIAFLQEGKAQLTQIETVNNFEVLSQISPKNHYDYGFSMIFKDQADYTYYNEHPIHVDFVSRKWLKNVTDFLEIDFETFL